MKIFDRKLFVWAIFSVMLSILVIRLAQLTIVEGETLSNKALDYRIKKMTMSAKRGEIYDRNGILVAGNLTTYGVNFLFDRKFDGDQQAMVIDLFTMVEESGGEIFIEMPIIYKNDDFIYKTNLKKSEWLMSNGFAENATPEDVLAFYRQREHISDDYDKYEADNILVAKGIYLPIRLDDMEFTIDFERRAFLENYQIDNDVTAREAIETFRKREKLDPTYTDQEAYYLLLLKHAINQKGNYKYEPIKIATGISKEAAIAIQEQSMKYPNVTISIEQERFYPQNYLASHILGYLGKISSPNEQKKYNEDTGYRPSDLVGKLGIEGVYESELKGESGYRYIEVNNEGAYINDLSGKKNQKFKDKAAAAGKNIQLTIDIELQEKVREYLIRNLEALRTGGVYQSEFGNTKYKDAYPYANTGAVVVEDVRTGEILSMVSYPDYDINLFARGITYEDYAKLQPENSRNPLAPRPLLNIATRTAVQPGSTFKMITGFAALEAGLNPYAYYTGAGYIKTPDGKSFGCWLWNKFSGMHGPLNLMDAIEVSCNYYFYGVGNGYDYARNTKMPFNVGAEKIIDAAKTFGLDEGSGVEISETVAGVPDPSDKKPLLLALLRTRLKKIAPDYFDEAVLSDEAALDGMIDKLIEVGSSNPMISRESLYDFINTKCGVSDKQKAGDLANIIKYSFFIQFEWSEGDTFNLSIGQGAHSYTPVQMARYISAVANGGYLYESTLIKTIGGEPTDREPYKFIDPNGYIQYLRKGMRQVVSGSRGSVKSFFAGFPIAVGAKTGTAEKEGKIQPPDEAKYILTYRPYIAPNIGEVELIEETDRLLYERTDHIAELLDTVRADDALQEDKDAAQKKIDTLVGRGYLTRGNVMRAALISLSDDTLTDEQIDVYKDEFDNFTWFVSFAPYDNPEIAVVVLIPQGGSGGYGAAVAKDIYGYYFGLTKEQNKVQE